MSELFDIPESLSPRMKWIRAKGVICKESINRPGQYVAWIMGEDRAFGATESEAIDNLADKLGVVNWEVKP